MIPRFTVRENILLGCYVRKDVKRFIPDLIIDLFLILKKFVGRRGGDLFGWQQQQLAFARALAMEPKLLSLYEPTEGIQPIFGQQIHAVIS